MTVDIHLCINSASTTYAVPSTTIEHVLSGSKGRSSTAIGLMGIPPEWLPILARVGFSKAGLQSEECQNIAAGRWILAFSMTGPPTAKAGEGQVSGTLPAGVTRAAKR